MGFNRVDGKRAAGQAQELMEEFMNQAYTQGHHSQMLSLAYWGCFTFFVDLDEKKWIFGNVAYRRECVESSMGLW